MATKSASAATQQDGVVATANKPGSKSLHRLQWVDNTVHAYNRDLQKSKGKKECRRRVLVGIMDSGKTCTLAEFAESKWSMVNSPWSLKLPNANNDDGHLLEMTGPHTVRLFPGGRLDYESRRCAKHKTDYQHESNRITAVKFSTEEPYGTAVASLDMKSGSVKIKEEWSLLPSLIVTFILGNILRKEGRSNLLMLGSEELSNGVVHNSAVGSDTNQAPLEKEVDVNAAANKENVVSASCGGGCGSGRGNGVSIVESKDVEDVGDAVAVGVETWQKVAAMVADVVVDVVVAVAVVVVEAWLHVVAAVAVVVALGTWQNVVAAVAVVVVVLAVEIN